MTSTTHGAASLELDATLPELIEQTFDRSLTAEEKAVTVIRNAIMMGILKPGVRLPQDRLAGLLKVSRMPIRSALRQLESEGLVQLHAHRGAIVRTLSLEEILDLYELRILIETFALKKTVRAINNAQIDALERMAAEVKNAPNDESWVLTRQKFYHNLYTIGNTPRVISTIMQLRAELIRYTWDLESPREQAHLDLLQRIRIGDPELAAAWLEAHLREVAQTKQAQRATRRTMPVDDQP